MHAMLAAVPTIVTVATVIAVGYLLGSIPVAGIVARRRAGTDLRTVGDRNPGYWNAKEVLGRRAAVPVFVGDVLKGAAAAGVGRVLAGDAQWWLAYVGAGAAMVGHAWPVLAGFRGGRSVLAFAGGACVFAPVPAAAAIGVLLVVLAATRRFDVAARAGVGAFPAVQLVVEGPWRTAATGVLMSLIGVRFAQAAWAERRTSAPATPAGG